MKIENNIQNIQDTAKATHTGKFIDVSTYLKEKDDNFLYISYIQLYTNKAFLKKVLKLKSI